MATSLHIRLLPATLFLPEEMARLSGGLGNDEDRLPLAFEIKRAAAVSEMGVVGDVVMGAIVAARRLVGWRGIHRVLSGQIDVVTRTLSPAPHPDRPRA